MQPLERGLSNNNGMNPRIGWANLKVTPPIQLVCESMIWDIPLQSSSVGSASGVHRISFSDVTHGLRPPVFTPGVLCLGAPAAVHCRQWGLQLCDAFLDLGRRILRALEEMNLQSYLD